MKGRIIAAILLMLIGTAWLLDLAGRPVFPGGIAVWWPSIVIVVGIVNLFAGADHWRGGAILIGIGALLQAWTLGYLPSDAWRYLAPAALIAIGILILLPPWRRRERWGGWHEGAPRATGKVGPEDVAVFSEHKLNAPEGSEYKGGELTAVFGSLDADLRHAKLPPEGARLKATSVFGGVRIRVPSDWRVEVHGTPVLGRTEDRTAQNGTGPKLDIEAVAVFGGVEVSNG